VASTVEAVGSAVTAKSEDDIVEPIESNPLRTRSRERQRAPRYQLLTRVDISVAGGHDTYWGGVVNVSQRGVTLLMKQPLNPHQQVKICFLFQSEDGKTTTEVLDARVTWRSGDNTGLQFETPLTMGSQARKGMPLLSANLETKDKLGDQYR